MNGRSPNVLRAGVQTVAQPVGHIGEHVAAVLLGADEHLIAVQTLHV